MDQGLKSNPIAAIDLERDVVIERPAGERFRELRNGEHCENAQCSPAARSTQLELKAHHPFRGLPATGLRC
jgi:hypothetical protein